MANRRARQAAETRAEILGAARALFAERGYSATSLKAIAERADVSVQTVYDSVGSKADLVLQLNDHIDEEAGIARAREHDPDRDGSGSAARDPCAHHPFPRRDLWRHRARVRVRFGRRPRAPTRRDGRLPAPRSRMRAVAARLGALGALRPEQTADDAAATIAVLTDSWFAVRLIDEYGWTTDRYEAWAVDMLRRALV